MRRSVASHRSHISKVNISHFKRYHTKANASISDISFQQSLMAKIATAFYTCNKFQFSICHASLSKWVCVCVCLLVFWKMQSPNTHTHIHTLYSDWVYQIWWFCCCLPNTEAESVCSTKACVKSIFIHLHTDTRAHSGYFFCTFQTINQITEAQRFCFIRFSELSRCHNSLELDIKFPLRCECSSFYHLFTSSEFNFAC